MSPIGVDEACALTQSISAGDDAGVRERDPHRPGRLATVARGWTMWWASDVAP